MTQANCGRLAGAFKPVLVLLAVFAVSLAAFGVASASAAPKGEWVNFAECPTANHELTGCIYSKTTKGQLTIGNQEVPIKNPQILQGGVIEEESGAERFVAAAKGNTFPPAPQVVPGGLLGTLCKALPGFLSTICNSFFSKGLTEVKATAELAAPASSIGINQNAVLAETGTGLSLPVKVKLENLFLGSKCYIGSNSNPLKLELTTGTTKPPGPNKAIKGKLGNVTVRGEARILVLEENELVDNSFSAPGANGCDGIFSFIVDPVLDTILGLPASGGHNTAILGGTVEVTGVEAAREHE